MKFPNIGDSLQLNAYLQKQKSYLQSVEDVEDSHTPSDGALLEMLHAIDADIIVTSANSAWASTYQESWNVQVSVENKKVLFEVDTGAEITAMSESACNSLSQQFCTVHNLRSNLLGLPAIRQLHMIPQIDFEKHSRSVPWLIYWIKQHEGTTLYHQTETRCKTLC